MVGCISITILKLRNQQGENMAKKIKLQNKDGDTIEVWDNQVDEYAQQGWTTESAKPKKKTTTKSITEEQGE
jgi:hypothetical protein